MFKKLLIFWGVVFSVGVTPCFGIKFENKSKNTLNLSIEYQIKIPFGMEWGQYLYNKDTKNIHLDPNKLVNLDADLITSVIVK